MSLAPWNNYTACNVAKGQTDRKNSYDGSRSSKSLQKISWKPMEPMESVNYRTTYMSWGCFCFVLFFWGGMFVFRFFVALSQVWSARRDSWFCNRLKIVNICRFTLITQVDQRISRMHIFPRTDTLYNGFSNLGREYTDGTLEKIFFFNESRTSDKTTRESFHQYHYALSVEMWYKCEKKPDPL